MVHSNESLIKRLYAGFATANMQVVDELLADEVTWHTPGNGAHAGTRRGKPELYATMARLAELTGGSLRSDVRDVLANDEHAIVLQRTRADRGDRPSLDDREVIVFHVVDGRVVEVWEHPGDADAMNAFFA